ncbi:MAG: 16S rRNA (cytosine(1402)-N(4))-methyltransferase RsmH [Elusimicrobiales bacterium]
MTSASHTPVMPQEALHWLAVNPDGVYFDGTCGLGGHSGLICARLSPRGRLVAADMDAQSLEIARENLAEYADRVVFAHGNYAGIADIAREHAKDGFDGALFDLGLSSWQLSQNRGFSFRDGGGLDMRYDRRRGVSAAEIVNTWPQEQLKDMIKRLGEERFAGQIASAIVKARAAGLIDTAARLAQTAEKAVPRRTWGAIHPATRTFQALRITVNGELENVEKSLKSLPSALKSGGRAVYITFQSLEDRLVKHAFRDMAADGSWSVLTRKPVVAQERETQENPRSRSAKLRAAQKI